LVGPVGIEPATCGFNSPVFTGSSEAS